MIIYCALILLLTLTYVFLFLYYLTGWVLLPEYKFTDHPPHTKTSIVIPARNEEENIGNVLGDLLKQNFPSELFEVIVVDDFSEDRTAEIVSSFQPDQVRLIRLREFLSGEESVFSYKKKALEVGIGNANGDLIITTDADCRMNSHWLRTMVNFYEDRQCHMVVAPVLIEEGKSFFSKFQSLDLIGLIGITGATLHLNFPTMCNGANLAFTKNSFYEVNGYEGISGKTSGDDMLLMHKIARQWNGGVVFLKNPHATILTKPLSTFSSFAKQRMRWTSKSKAYKDLRIILNLLVILLFNVSIIFSLAISLFDYKFFPLFLATFATKAIMDFVFLAQVTKYFHRQRLMWLFLPAEIIHVFYIVIAGIAGNFLTVTWKGRIVK